jgi:hypothetical protein
VSVKDSGWVFNGLLVVVDFLQVLLLYLTLKTIGRQADIAEKQETQMIRAGEQTERIISQMQDTAQRQLRAYVSVPTALLNFKTPEAPEVQVHIKNTGQTPAYDTQGWIHMWLESYPLAIVLPEPPEDFHKAKELLGPDCIRVFVNTMNIAVPLLPVIGTPFGTIYVYGEIRYKDAFGENRFTKYRFIYGGNEGVRNSKPDSNGVITALLKPASDGNEAN